MKEFDLNLTEAGYPVPMGISLSYIIIVDYSNLFPHIAVNLQLTCNDGERITILSR